MRTTILSSALGLTLLAGPASAQFPGPPILLPGDTGTEVAAGLQQRPVGAAGDGQFLVVWEDGRSVLGDFQEKPPTTSSLSLVKSDLLAARFDAQGNRLDDAPIVVSGLPWIQRYAQVAWNGSSYLVVWQAEVASALTYTDAIFAARVGPDGSVLDDPPILVEDSIDADETDPAVASDGQDWVVTWSDFDPAAGLLSVEGARITAGGVLVQKTTLGEDSSGFYAPRKARIAFAVDRYLVTWEHFGASGEQRNLYGHFFDPGLAPIGAEFEIAGGPGNQEKAAVSTNGGQFFVAWGGMAGATPVALDGTVVVPGGLPFHAGTPAYGWTPSAAWDGSAYLVSWEGATSQGYSLHTAHIDTAGALLPGSPTTLEGGLPFASDSVMLGAGGLGLVLWSDTRLGDWQDVWSRTLDAAGNAGPLQPVAVGAPSQTHVDLDGDAVDGYLVSFVRRVSGSEAVQIQRVDAAGNALDPTPTTLVADVPNRLTHTAVAHGTNGWLVVWEDIGQQRVQGMRVGLDGVPLYAAPVDIVAGNTPDVAFLGGEYLVVSSYRPINHQRIPRIRRMQESDGALLGPEESVGSGYCLWPTVEALADRWMIAYEARATHDSPWSSITGLLVLGDGTAQPPISLSSGSFATLREPALAGDGAGALLVWTNGEDIRGRRIAADGSLLDTSAGFVVCDAPGEQRLPAATWDGARWAVAWTDYRLHLPLDPGVGDVYANYVEPDTTVSSLTGVPLANQPMLAEGAPALAGGAETTLAATNAFRSEGTIGGLRVELRSMREGAGVPLCFGDGTGATCPCGNFSSTTTGCANSTSLGAELLTSGSASVQMDDLRLVAAQIPAGKPALAFSGSDLVSAGAGSPLGDGLLCAGGTIERLVVAMADGLGGASWGPGLAAQEGWGAGQRRIFQVWYRDPGGPCSGGFNLTNAIDLTFVP